MKRKCQNWNDCLHLAREKFDKYFSNKVNELVFFFQPSKIYFLNNN